MPGQIAAAMDEPVRSTRGANFVLLRRTPGRRGRRERVALGGTRSLPGPKKDRYLAGRDTGVSLRIGRF
jgi:hypothetical protein